MDYLRKLRILVVGVFLLMTRIEGQLDGDSLRLCDFCHMDGLPDCNTTEMMHVNMTMNCELTSKGCTLGIDQTFEGFDNFTMDDGIKEQICLFRDVSVETTTDPTTSTITERTEGYEHLRSTTEGTFVESAITYDSLDYQSDQSNAVIRSFRSDPAADPSKTQPPPPNERITCHACNSSSDKTCLSMVDKVNTIECPKETGCMAMFLDGNVIRDCSSSIGPEDVLHCQKPENMSCISCPDAMCNKMPWQQCYQCNSKDNPNCALWSSMDTIPRVACPNHNDKCLVRITTDGDTVRECSRVDFQPPQGELYSTCDGTLCNAGVYPENRRHCIQCQNCEESEDPSAALPCAIYDSNEQCYLYVTLKSKMNRGCRSNSAEMQQCELNKPKCITCNENGCNNAPLMKDATLSCSKCNSKTNESCAWAQPVDTVMKCQNRVLYYLEETCMMDLDPEKQTAVRDCSFDYGVCTPEDKECRTCTGDGCNRGNLKVQQCIQCSSNVPEQSKCAELAEGIPSTKCPQETQMFNTKGCFSMTKENITTRGCIAGLTEDDLKFCKTEGKSCELCMDDGCNNLLALSRGWRTKQISLFAVIGAIFINL